MKLCANGCNEPRYTSRTICRHCVAAEMRGRRLKMRELIPPMQRGREKGCAPSVQKIDPSQYPAIRARIADGETRVAVAKSLKVSVSTIRRICRFNGTVAPRKKTVKSRPFAAHEVNLLMNAWASKQIRVSL